VLVLNKKKEEKSLNKNYSKEKESKSEFFPFECILCFKNSLICRGSLCCAERLTSQGWRNDKARNWKRSLKLC
jgi:hypothetical protein